MSTTLKLIIPLITRKLKKENLTEKCGFVGAYSKDLNLYGECNNYIHLMFEYFTKGKDKIQTYYDIKNAKEFNYESVYRINGNLYTVFSFPIYGKSARSFITSNIAPSTKDDKLKIVSFWGTTEDDVNSFLFEPENWFKFSKFEHSYLPKIDRDIELPE